MTAGTPETCRRTWWGRLHLFFIVLAASLLVLAVYAAEPPVVRVADQSQEAAGLQVEVIKKGLGKEVSIRKGNKEWFMLIEVTVDNTVVVRQEKENDTYLLDESETHDRAMTKAEVDAAIEDFINSVKTKARQK
jgi:hypothetical protein